MNNFKIRTVEKSEHSGKAGSMVQPDHIVYLNYNAFLFPAGEVGIKLEDNPRFVRNDAPITIIARIHNSQNVVELMMIKDAVERMCPNRDIHLFMPYFNYGRQDRVCVKGESFSLKVFANLINGLYFKSVTVADPHSEVTSALIDNVRVITQDQIIHQWDELCNRILQGVVFVAPDAGANKKTSTLAKYFNHSGFVRADKLRNLATGEILETIVYETDFNGRDVIVADDLADGGKTYTELAKVLKAKNCGKVILYVTHAILSKGADVLFNNGIDEIWVTNSYREDLDSRIKTFNIESFAP